MAKINENILSKHISQYEGGAKELSIGQIKEVQRILLELLAVEWETGNELGVIELLKKHIGR